MSRSDKRFADVLRLPFSPEKGGQFACELVGGGVVSDSARYDIATDNAALTPSVVYATAIQIALVK